jgi:DNA polymerase-3 subunit delta
MVALKAADIDRFVARPNPAQPVILVYGPDAGLVRERTDALVRSAVDNVDDPFSLVRLEGDALTSEPARLIEEAHTIPLFGGRRAIWVKAGARSNIAPAVEALLADTPPDCRVVIEAGELRRTAPVRTLCERAKNAAVLPCYTDNEQALARLIDAEMQEAGLAIAPEAREALVPLLGGDRMASRSEVRKLALYARGKERVELDDVAAVVADASDLASDALIDAAFAGRIADVEFQFAKARTAGTSPGSILLAAQRALAPLHKARLMVDDGTPAASAVERMIPPVHFSRKAVVAAALTSWTAARLERAMAQLADAVLESRKQADLAEALAQRTLLSLAMSARRKES